VRPFFARREKNRERSAEFAVQCAFEIREMSADIVAKEVGLRKTGWNKQAGGMCGTGNLSQTSRPRGNG
jgi:hypothetical protein